MNDATRSPVHSGLPLGQALFLYVLVLFLGTFSYVLGSVFLFVAGVADALFDLQFSLSQALGWTVIPFLLGGLFECLSRRR